MTAGRRADVELTWQGTDVSLDANAALLDLTYTDHLSGTADDLTLELQDRAGLWSGDWRPAFGDEVEARIKAEPWLTEVEDLRLGLFSHDHSGYRGPPRTLTLKCVSAALSTGLRRQRKHRAWSGVTLRAIANDIAAAAVLPLQWDTQIDTSLAYKRREQIDRSDLDFLVEECANQGLAVKITEGFIVVFDEAKREQTASIGTIELAGGHVLGWDFNQGKSDHYGRCTVKCFDPRSGKTIEHTFDDPDDAEGPTLEVKRSVSSEGEAETIARALLRQANQFGATGSLTVVGDPGLVAGVTFDLTSAYGFDGKYVVTKATHKPTGGYTIGLDIRRCLEGY